MAKMGGDREEITEQKAVFVDTNLDTHLAIPVSFNDTILDIKRRIQSEHLKCFLNFGEIQIHALKVRRKRQYYHLSDLMPVRSVFGGIANKWFLYADISCGAIWYEAVDHNTEFHPDTHLPMLPGPSIPSSLQRVYKKDDRGLQTDSLSGDAGSGNLQIVVHINNDDNLKSSSSDTYKRLNPNVEGIFNASREKDKVPVLDSERKGRKSSGLATEVTSVNPVRESLEKNSLKKKKKIAGGVHALDGNGALEVKSMDGDSVIMKIESMKNLDQNVDDFKHFDHDDTGVRSANHDKQGHASSDVDHSKHSAFDLKNQSAPNVEHTVGPYGEGNRIVESDDRDMLDVTEGSGKTKQSTKKRNKRKKKNQVVNDEVFPHIDASVNISAKSHGLPVGSAKGRSSRSVLRNVANDQCIGNDTNEASRSSFPDNAVISDSGTMERHSLQEGADNLRMNIECNESNAGNPINMDEDKTEDLERLGKLDFRGGEGGTTAVGVVPDSEMKKSNKRKKDEDVVTSQMDVKGNEELGVTDIGDMETGMIRPKKRKKTVDDAIKMDGVGNEEAGVPSAGDAERKIKTTRVAPTPGIKGANKRKNDEYDVIDAGLSVLSVEESDKATVEEQVVLRNVKMVQPDTDRKERLLRLSDNDDPEAKQSKLAHTSMMASSTNSASQKQKTERAKNSKTGLKTGDSNVEMQDLKDKENFKGLVSHLPSSRLDEDHITSNLTKKYKLKLRSELKKTDREADNISQNDSDLMQLTQNQKSRGGTDSEGKKPKKKIKQKQSSTLMNSSDFPVKDQNNSMKPERNKSTWSKSEAQKDDVNESSSSHREHNDKAIPMAAMEADIEIRSNEAGLDDEVLSTNHGSDDKPLLEADDMSQNDAESIQLTQNQKNHEPGENKSKISKKSKPKQNLAVRNISEFPEKNENNSMKRDRSISTCSKKAAEKDNEMESLSSYQEQIDRTHSVVDAKADIGMRSAIGAVDGEAVVKDDRSDVNPRIEADKIEQNDAEPMQLTQTQKSKKDNGNDTKSKKNTKEKQNPVEFPLKDQNNSMQVERSSFTWSTLDAEKGEMESLFSPVEQIDIVSPGSAPQAMRSAKAQVDDEVVITNHESDVNPQQGADDACQNDVEPMLLTQVHISERDTENKSVKPKKKTKQQQTRTGKNLPEFLHTARDDTSNDISLEKDLKIAPVKVPLNASKNRRNERTSSGPRELQESTDIGKQERSMKFSGARPNAANLIKTNKNDDSGTSTADADSLDKSSRQGKPKKQLPKVEQHQARLPKSSNRSIGKVVQKPSEKRSLIRKSGSIFKDESSSSSEDKAVENASDSSTETPHDHISSSDFSEGESRGSWVSPRRGNLKKDGGANSLCQSMVKKLPMESILRSSHKYKKAKLVASQLQLEDDESQPVDCVPDSQVNI